MSTLNSPPVEVSELAPSEGGPPALTTGGPVSGVYGIWCVANEKWYVGQSAHIQRRWRQHHTRLLSKSHTNKCLQGTWNKYGEPAFLWIVLARCSPGADSDSVEKQLIRDFKAMAPLGLNLTLGGERPVWTEQARANLSAALAGIPHGPLPEETKQKIAVAHRGRPLTESHKQNISRAHLGKPKSEAHRRHISEARKGRRVSEGTRKKLSRLARGRIRPPAAIEKQRLTCAKNKKTKEEQRWQNE